LLTSFLQDTAASVEAEIDRLLGSPADHAAPRLVEAMRYAALGGGKRLRAALVRAVADALAGASQSNWMATAAAIEAVHAYSLIHDDLPAMDDASTRRGRPACHLAFDEATAVLAGDALQAVAFEWIAGDARLPEIARLTLIAGLARAAGAAGMCGGQMLDLQGEANPPDLAGLEQMERLKTGAMIAFAAEAGAVIAGADAPVRHHVVGWARCLGLAFQIKDDLLDVEGDGSVTGKDAGLDAVRGKTTFVSLMGVKAARERLDVLALEASHHLGDLGVEVNLLDSIFHYVVTRDR
jgi:farnesyl diphosphate synthase